MASIVNLAEEALLARQQLPAEFGPDAVRPSYDGLGLANAAADLFPHIPKIVAMLPDEMDQMKFFELIQIVPTPTRAALASGDIASYQVTDARVMGFLRNNSIFTFGHANKTKRSATYREIFDAMWLFNPKFDRALKSFNELV